MPARTGGPGLSKVIVLTGNPLRRNPKATGESIERLTFVGLVGLSQLPKNTKGEKKRYALEMRIQETSTKWENLCFAPQISHFFGILFHYPK